MVASTFTLWPRLLRPALLSAIDQSDFRNEYRGRPYRSRDHSGLTRISPALQVRSHAYQRLVGLAVRRRGTGRSFARTSREGKSHPCLLGHSRCPAGVCTHSITCRIRAELTFPSVFKISMYDYFNIKRAVFHVFQHSPFGRHVLKRPANPT